jgi:hypothetical protein
MVDLAASAALYALLMACAPGLARPVGGVGATVLVCSSPSRSALTTPRRRSTSFTGLIRRANLVAAVAVSHAGGPSAIRRPEVRWFFSPQSVGGIVEGLRSSLVFGRAPDWQVVAISAALIGLLLVVSATCSSAWIFC